MPAGNGPAVRVIAYTRKPAYRHSHNSARHSRENGNPAAGGLFQIPACAGMTVSICNCPDPLQPPQARQDEAHYYRQGDQGGAVDQQGNPGVGRLGQIAPFHLP